MLNLPEHRSRIRVWPRPGRNVMAAEPSPRPSGWMRPEGKEVTWSPFWHRRLLSGDIHLHDPRPGAAVDPRPLELAAAQSAALRAQDVADSLAKEAEDAQDAAKIAAERAAQAKKAALAAAQAAVADLTATPAKPAVLTPAAVPSAAPASPKEK